MEGQMNNISQQELLASKIKSIEDNSILNVSEFEIISPNDQNFQNQSNYNNLNLNLQNKSDILCHFSTVDCTQVSGFQKYRSGCISPQKRSFTPYSTNNFRDISYDMSPSKRAKYRSSPLLKNHIKLGNTLGNNCKKNEERNQENELLQDQIFNKQFKEKLESLKNIFVIIKMKQQGIQQFILASQSYRFRTLNDNIVNYFNDKSYFYKTEEKQFIKSSTPQYIDRLLDKIPVLQPSGSFKFYWNLLQSLVILFGFGFIPLHLAFGNTLNIGGVFFNISMLILFALDITVNLNTGIYKKGLLVMNRRKIMHYYIKRRLFRDIFSNLPLCIDLLITNSQHDLYSYDIFLILFFLKFKEFLYMQKQLYEQFHFDKIYKHLFDLVKLVCLLILFQHLYACLLIYVSRYLEKQDIESWKHTVNVPLNGAKLYNYAFYFATVTMVTVGYGDIYPQTQIEIMLAIVFMMFACIIYAYFIGNIQSILHDLQKDHTEKNDILTSLNRYVKNKSISISLKHSLIEYIEFYFKDNVEDQNKFEQKLRNMLSQPLKIELLKESHSYATKSPFFTNNFSELVQNKVISLIKEVKTSPEQEIFMKDDSNTNLYFIDQGEIDIFIQGDRDLSKSNDIKIINTLQKGDCFGAYEFFTGKNNRFSARSKHFGTLLCIKREEFINLLKEYPEDFEIYQFIKDSINFSKNLNGINNKCYACEGQFHIVTECPYIAYIPNKAKLWKKCEPQERQKYDRDKHLIFGIHPLRQLDIVQQQTQVFMNDNSEIFDDLSWLIDENEFNSSYYSKSFSSIDFIDEDEDEDNIKEILENNNLVSSKAIKNKANINLDAIQINMENGNISTQRRKNMMNRKKTIIDSQSKTQFSQDQDVQINQNKGMLQTVNIQSQLYSIKDFGEISRNSADQQKNEMQSQTVQRSPIIKQGQTSVRRAKDVELIKAYSSKDNLNNKIKQYCKNQNGLKKILENNNNTSQVSINMESKSNYIKNNLNNVSNANEQSSQEKHQDDKKQQLLKKQRKNQLDNLIQNLADGIGQQVKNNKQNSKKKTTLQLNNNRVQKNLLSKYKQYNNLSQIDSEGSLDDLDNIMIPSRKENIVSQIQYYFSLINNFDSGKEYNFYYPQFNQASVIGKFELQQKFKFSELKVKKRKNRNQFQTLKIQAQGTKIKSSISRINFGWSSVFRDNKIDQSNLKQPQMKENF